MRMFAQKQKPTPPVKSTTFVKPGRQHLGHSLEVQSTLHLQRTIGNQAVQRLLQAHTDNPKASSANNKSIGFTHDFSRIPLHGRPLDTVTETERVRRTYCMKTVPDSSGFETTVAPPGAAADEEMTLTDGGGSGAPILQRAATFCQCIPTSASIKNVTKYTKGKLYGHKFDFVVDLTYSKRSSSATKHKDCSLEWREKTTRPPAWQTVIKKNTWHDMFALYPTSPTFDGWTKSRTKPCPGKETAKIHDPPAASVNLPARTLWFDLKVKGGGTTKSATGNQVLEPDGKGGIKKQTFTVT